MNDNHSEIQEKTRSQIQKQTRSQIQDKIIDQIHKPLINFVNEQVSDTVQFDMDAQLRNPTMRQVWWQVGSRVKAQLNRYG